MKRVLIALILSACLQQACETSEGVKYGILQKVSEKTFPCQFYEAEFAFEGGRAVSSSDGKSNAYDNTQRVEISREAYDTLQIHVGDRVVFDYRDRGIVGCGQSKLLTSLRVKD